MTPVMHCEWVRAGFDVDLLYKEQLQMLALTQIERGLRVGVDSILGLEFRVVQALGVWTSKNPPIHPSLASPFYS